jgi:hypothetical protein
MTEEQLAVMRGPDRDVHGANVPRLIVEDGAVRVSFERREGALYSKETPARSRD